MGPADRVKGWKKTMLARHSACANYRPLCNNSFHFGIRSSDPCLFGPGFGLDEQMTWDRSCIKSEKRLDHGASFRYFFKFGVWRRVEVAQKSGCRVDHSAGTGSHSGNSTSGGGVVSSSRVWAPRGADDQRQYPAWAMVYP
jgi:hypothetical protein